MPAKVVMPAMSPTMTEGNVAKWLKKEGDRVKAGDVLAEIETDKATMELEAADDGRLAKILVPQGIAPVNAPIGVLLGDGEDEAALEKFLSEIGGAPKPAVRQPPEPPPAPRETKPKPQPVKPRSVPPSPVAAGGRLFASPLAKRIAKQTGLDLSTVRGSGPRGRVVKADVAGGAPGAPAPLLRAKAAPAGAAPFVEIPLTMMRKAIARRMSESKREAPHFYLTVDCEVDALLAGRADVNAVLAKEAAPGEEPIKISVNDIVIRAVALALEKVPEANVAYFGERLRQYSRVDVAVAIAVPGGLITPIVFDAASKGLAAIAREMRDLSARATAGQLAPAEYEGGTFTISNLGMYGIKEFSAVINPPQACLLAVGEATPRAVVRDGAVVPAAVMTCTLSIDHRAVDGVIGARWLAEFKRLIEHPLAMLL
ncbi:MAG TPA: pyruvate dehydrogenase complex dihydrolipoamide acetyltransferase [Alphaproteobacteria bacterium]|nr:pyruvate dehydrogenase complex dihydrolipoamide acetyltransferase [Alphaproteobacteria bacterium]